LGWSVSIRDQYAVAEFQKLIKLSSSICYLQGSLFQNHFCESENEFLVNGQFILYNKDTGSIPDTTGIDWNIKNTYQIKKKYLSPYRSYGWDVSISDQFIIIGSPLLISGSQEVMDLGITTTGSVDEIGDIGGKSYIYNLKNLRHDFYVGNVFYRNGKMVIMVSGSSFDGLQLNNTSVDDTDII
jgi:hypothetical protein